jgi:hypothetical protein
LTCAPVVEITFFAGFGWVNKQITTNVPRLLLGDSVFYAFSNPSLGKNDHLHKQ